MQPSGTFSGDKSMRVNYEQGVDVYYQQTGDLYRNPHFMGICKAASCILEVWWPLVTCAMQQANDSSSSRGEGSLSPNGMRKEEDRSTSGVICVLDLAAGSGEATQALESWWSNPGSGGGGGTAAKMTGPQRFRPPPSSLPISSAPAPSCMRPQSSGLNLKIDASDPYTHESYARVVGRPSERFSFQDVADGYLTDRAYHLCICRCGSYVSKVSKSQSFHTFLV